MTRYLLLTSAILLCGGPLARAADVYFAFTNSVSRPQALRYLYLYPQNPTTAGGGILTRDRVVVPTGSGGSVVVSNLVWGLYRAEFEGLFARTTNWFAIPDTNGYINAATYRVSLTNDAVLAYSKAEIDTLFSSVAASPEQITAAVEASLLTNSTGKPIRGSGPVVVTEQSGTNVVGIVGPVPSAASLTGNISGSQVIGKVDSAEYADLSQASFESAYATIASRLQGTLRATNIVAVEVYYTDPDAPQPGTTRKAIALRSGGSGTGLIEVDRITLSGADLAALLAAKLGTNSPISGSQVSGTVSANTVGTHTGPSVGNVIGELGLTGGDDLLELWNTNSNSKVVYVTADGTVYGYRFISLGPSGTNMPPNGVILSPTGTQTITAGQSITFFGTGTDDDGHYPVTYLWQFGSGSGIADSTAQNPTVTFNTLGSFTVTLTVTDSLGLSDPTPATLPAIVVSAPPPPGPEIYNVAVTETNYTDCTIGWSVLPNSYPNVVDIGITTAFGHGSFAADGTNVAAHASPSAQIGGLAQGVTYYYQVRSRASEVWSTNGPQAFVTPQNQPPVATISSPSGNVSIQAGQAVTFAGSGSDPESHTPLTYNWTFSNSGIAPNTNQNPGALTFTNAGTFLCYFTVTDSLGLAGTPASRTVTVTNAPVSSEPVLVSINGGFEITTEAGVAAHWTTNGGSVYVPAYAPRAYADTNYVLFNAAQGPANGWIEQVVSSTSTDQHVMSFALGANWNSGTLSIRATVTSASGSVLYSNVFNQAASGNGTPTYTLHTNLYFTADATNFTVRFTDVTSNPTDRDMELDEVAIYQLPVGEPPPSGEPTPDVVMVNLASDQGELRHVGSGILHNRKYLDMAEPMQTYYRTIGLNNYRGWYQMIETNWGRLAELDLDFTILSPDSFGYGAQSAQASGDYATWDAQSSNAVWNVNAQSMNHKVWWEPFNEPNDSAFWPGSEAQLFAAYKHNYDLVKSVNPNIKVIAPSYNNFYLSKMRSFAIYARDNNCIPDAWCYHELNDGAEVTEIANNAAIWRAELAALGITQTNLVINEYLGYHFQHSSGGAVWEMANLEQIPELLFASKSCWADKSITSFGHCEQYGLNGMLNSSYQRRDIWRTYQVYGSTMSGSRKLVTPYGDVNGIATYDEFGRIHGLFGHKSRVEIALNAGDPYTITFTNISGLGNAAYDEVAYVTVERIISSLPAPAQQWHWSWLWTNTVTHYQVPVSIVDDAITVTVTNFMPSDAVYITILPTTNQPPQSVIAVPSADVIAGTSYELELLGNASDPDSNTPLSYLWQFQAPPYAPQLPAGFANATTIEAGPYSWANYPGGKYQISFTVSDALGLADPSPALRFVTITNPVYATLTNGSFELGWRGWDTTNWTGTLINVRSSAGTNGLQFNSGNAPVQTAVWQTVQTLPLAGYRLQFDLGVSTNFSDRAGQLNLTAGNAVSYPLTVTPPAGASNYFVSFTNALIMATSNRTTVRFDDATGNGGVGFDTLLDNVRMTAAVNTNGNLEWFTGGLPTDWNTSGNVTNTTRSVNGTNAFAFSSGQTAPDGMVWTSFPTTQGATYRVWWAPGVVFGPDSKSVSAEAWVSGSATQSVTRVGQNLSTATYSSATFAFTAATNLTTLWVRDTSTNSATDVDLVVDSINVFPE